MMAKVRRRRTWGVSSDMHWGAEKGRHLVKTVDYRRRAIP
jgi:hypothetical protein